MTAIARATEIWSCTCHDIPYTAFPVPVTVTNAFDPIQSLLHSVMWPCACFTTSLILLCKSLPLDSFQTEPSVCHIESQKLALRRPAYCWLCLAVLCFVLLPSRDKSMLLIPIHQRFLRFCATFPKYLIAQSSFIFEMDWPLVLHDVKDLENRTLGIR